MTKDRLCYQVGAGALAFAVGVRALAGFGPVLESELRNLAERPGVVRRLLGAEFGPIGPEVVFRTADSAAKTAEPEAPAEVSPEEEEPAAEPSLSEEQALQAVSGPETSCQSDSADSDLEGTAVEAVTSEQSAPVAQQAASAAVTGLVEQDPLDEAVWIYSADPVSNRAEDSSAVSLTQICSFQNQTDYDPDLEALLSASVTLAGEGLEGPQVLIVHTHGTESYTPEAGDTYEETDPFHTLDQSRNVTGLGTVLAQTLQAAGVGVVHDRAYHDYPAYNGSYTRTAEDIQALLSRYPSIRLVVDLHRDSVQEADGSWMATAESGEAGAKLLLVVGSDAGGLENPDWQNNLALALQVQARMGDDRLCRGVNLRTERFNQQLAPTLLAELGACGDTWTQAEKTVRTLGQALAALLAEQSGSSPPNPSTDGG